MTASVGLMPWRRTAEVQPEHWAEVLVFDGTCYEIAIWVARPVAEWNTPRYEAGATPETFPWWMPLPAKPDERDEPT